MSGPGIVASIWRYRVVVVVVMMLTSVAAYFAIAQLPDRYQAEAVLYLRDPDSQGPLGGGTPNRNGDLDIYMAKQAGIMTSREVLVPAKKLIGTHQSIRDLRSALSVRPSANLANVTIQASAGSAKGAADLANAVATAYQQVSRQRIANEATQAINNLQVSKVDLQRRLAAMRNQRPSDSRPSPEEEGLNNQIANLQQHQEEIRTQQALYGTGVELVEAADPPQAPSQPRPKFGALLGALVGLLGAGSWAWWSAPRNRRARTRDDPASVLRAPLLGEIPHFRAPALAVGEPIPSLADLGPTVTEAYHFVVASLEHVLAASGGSSVVVTSAAPGDGKTSTTLNLAMAAQRENRQIVLVDADERTRQLSELCGAKPRPDSPGLHDDEPIELTRLLRVLDLAYGSIVMPILPNESEHPAGFFRTATFRKALISLGEQSDLVLIDTPPLLAVSDAITIAGQADGVLLVVNRGVMLRQLRDVRDQLDFVGTPLLGYVFNRSTSSLDPYARTYGRTLENPKPVSLAGRIRARLRIDRRRRDDTGEV